MNPRYSEAYIAAMYLIFLRAPRNPNPDIDGHYSLGEIGTARTKSWTRLTPYSTAKKEPHEEYVQVRTAGLLGA